MRELRRCRSCRHEFKPNYRNVGKIDHPQSFCGKPACQIKSRQASKERYRALYAEEPSQVAVRMAAWRAKRRGRIAETFRAGEFDEPVGQAAHSGEYETLPAPAMSQMVAAALTGGILRVSAQMASLIATEACYGIAESLEILIATGVPGASARTFLAGPVVTG